VILYLDTSALVKVYVEEIKSADVREMSKKLKVLRHQESLMLKRRPRSRESEGSKVCHALITVLWSAILTKIGTIISLLMSLSAWFAPRGFWRRIMSERHRRHSSCLRGDFEQTGGRKYYVSLFRWPVSHCGEKRRSAGHEIGAGCHLSIG
jgi:hypothetical protein